MSNADNPAGSIGAIVDALNTIYPSSYQCDTPYCSLIHAGGDFVTKSVTLTGNGASTENLFTVTGQVRVIGIYFDVDSVTDSTTFSNVKLETDDGTAQDDITAIVNGSGCVAGSLFQRNNTSGNALGFHDAAAGGVLESALSDVLAPFSLIQKNATTTYVRLSYTGDANTDITITAYCRYAPLCSASCKVEAV